jgi:pimeloyl-ACP methyl ester carboxylesterase
MRKPLLVGALLLAGLVAKAPGARADQQLAPGDDDQLVTTCQPTREHPYPVILIHGHGGTYHDLDAPADRLRAEGRCVFATNYGRLINWGMEHLSTSADQINAFIDQVLLETRAQKVDIVAHSAGGGVAENLLLEKHVASKIHNVVAFGGLQHPYAHLGAAGAFDAQFYLPNLMMIARKIVPGITIKKLIDTLNSIFPIDPGMYAITTSNFVYDLFEPSYWQGLQGGQSEPPDMFVRIGIGPMGHSIPTHDNVQGVCYTNICGIADFIAGQLAVFQDPAPNVDNFILTTTVTANQHTDMLGDTNAHDRMMAGLNRECGDGSGISTASLPLDEAMSQNTPRPTPEESAAQDRVIAALQALAAQENSSSSQSHSGCMISTDGSTSTSGGGLFVFVGGLVTWLRRRRITQR